MIKFLLSKHCNHIISASVIQIFVLLGDLYKINAKGRYDFHFVLSGFTRFFVLTVFALNGFHCIMSHSNVHVDQTGMSYNKSQSIIGQATLTIDKV